MTAQLTDADAGAIAEMAACELSRRSLLDFARRVYPRWQDARHLTMIADLLEQVEAGKIKRLMINLPPRHGKSLLCSAIFPAWYLGRHNRSNIIMATHSQELSDTNSRNARDCVVEKFWPFDSKLSADSASVSRWNLSLGGGGVFACGVGSSITGRGANILILDDILHDSGTEGERVTAWRWFTEIAVPRLEPNAAIIAIGTRFAEDDVFGRLLEGPDKDEWTVLRLPAISEENDPLNRQPDEALWPQRISLGELYARKRSMGMRAFDCQFQQNPVPLEGNLIKAEWLSQRYNEPPKAFNRIICALDAAAKTGVGNDYSAIVTIGVTDRAFFVLDVWRDKVEFAALMRRVAMLQGDAFPPSAIYVEDASNATALIQQMRETTTLPIVPVVAKGSKLSRVEGITGILEAKKVLLPKDDAAPWVLDFLRELLAFDKGRHDDMVDAFTMALTQIAGKDRMLSGEEIMDRLNTPPSQDGDLYEEAVNLKPVASELTDGEKWARMSESEFAELVQRHAKGNTGIRNQMTMARAGVLNRIPTNGFLDAMARETPREGRIAR